MASDAGKRGDGPSGPNAPGASFPVGGKALLSGFAFLSIFSFLPTPLFPENEIFPYFLVPAVLFLAQKDLRKALAVTGSAVALGAAALAARGGLDVIVTDTLQVIAVGVALYCGAALSEDERDYFARRLKFAVWAVIGFMLLQYVFPSLVDFTYAHLVRRQATALELQAHTGGVPGIAPEPAYMGSCLIGAWMVVRRFTRSESTWFTLSSVAGVLLTASLSASLTLGVLLTIQFTTSPRRVLQYGLMMTAGIVLVSLLDSSLISRVGTLVEVGGGDGPHGLELLAAVDAAFGSIRLASLVLPLSEFGCGAYFCDATSFVKGYSMFAVVYALLAPLHLVVGIALLARSRDRLAASSALLAVFYGPVLNWTMYAGLLRRSQSDEAGGPEGVLGGEERGTDESRCGAQDAGEGV